MRWLRMPEPIEWDVEAQDKKAAAQVVAEDDALLADDSALIARHE